MRLEGELKVNLNYLRSNFNLLRSEYLKDNEIIFMIKADAYGHGKDKLFEFAYKECDVRDFGVACLGEALELRNSFPEIQAQLWVFSDLNLQSHYKDYENFNIIPVLSQLDDLKFVLEQELNIPLVLKFNTGMNRLGLNPSDTDKIIELLKQSEKEDIFHIMTHFANSYFPLKPGDKNERQYDLFKQIKKKLRDAGIEIKGSSVSNSGAIEQGFGVEESHVRPGLMLYGPSPMFKDSKWQGKIISSLTSKIAEVFPIKKGTPVGYGSHVCAEDGLVAVVPLGYGDGVLGYYSGLKQEFFDGIEGQFLGRINMDLSLIHFKEGLGQLMSGTDISLWNETQGSIQRITQHAKTTAYQVFTSVNSRVPRRYYD